MERYIIRKMRLTHCKRGPLVCAKCREMNVEKICLLDIVPPDEGLVQRRVIQVEENGEKVWREFEIVRTFDSHDQAREYARDHGITQVEI